MAKAVSQTANAKRKRLARQIKRGENPLGGEFAAIVNVEQFSRSAGPDDWVELSYDPTNTTWPENGWDHRRTDRAGYNRNTQTLRIQFHTNGAIYDYFDVPPSVARNFRRVASPGKFINRILNNYAYMRIN